MNDELEIEPESVTTALFQLIQAGLSTAEEPTAALVPAASDSGRGERGQPLYEVPLLGREVERRILADWMSALHTPRPPMLLLAGEAGVGKSRLASEAADEAYRRGIAVLWGHHYELTAPLPYGGLVAALRTGLQLGAPPPVLPIWLSEVSRLLPELSALRPDLPPPVALPPDQERVRLWEGLVQYLLALAAARPHLIIIEDVQWIDAASLDLLQYLLPRLPGSGFRLLATARTDDLQDRADLLNVLDALESSRALERLAVRRLPPESVADPVCHALHLEETPRQFGQRLWQETEGNVYFALETLRLWVEQGLVQRGPQGVLDLAGSGLGDQAADLPMPASVRRVIGQRVQRIGRPRGRCWKWARCWGIPSPKRSSGAPVAGGPRRCSPPPKS